jgi:hypothetical protein
MEQASCSTSFMQKRLQSELQISKLNFFFFVFFCSLLTTVQKVNSVHPGIFKTNLHREENEPVTAKFFTNFISPIFYGVIGISPAEAARSSIFLATEVQPTF